MVICWNAFALAFVCLFGNFFSFFVCVGSV